MNKGHEQKIGEKLEKKKWQFLFFIELFFFGIQSFFFGQQNLVPHHGRRQTTNQVP